LAPFLVLSMIWRSMSWAVDERSVDEPPPHHKCIVPTQNWRNWLKLIAEIVFTPSKFYFKKLSKLSATDCYHFFFQIIENEIFFFNLKIFTITFEVSFPSRLCWAGAGQLVLNKPVWRDGAKFANHFHLFFFILKNQIKSSTRSLLATVSSSNAHFGKVKKLTKGGYTN
jgi:hypothetical protein